MCEKTVFWESAWPGPRVSWGSMGDKAGRSVKPDQERVQMPYEGAGLISRMQCGAMGEEYCHQICVLERLLSAIWRVKYQGIAIVGVVGSSQGRHKSSCESKVAIQARNNEGLNYTVAEREVPLQSVKSHCGELRKRRGDRKKQGEERKKKRREEVKEMECRKYKESNGKKGQESVYYSLQLSRHLK